jgi:hypothetical protein
LSLRFRIRTSNPTHDAAAPAESTATLARRLVAGQTAELPRLLIQGGPCHGQELLLEKQGQVYRIGRSASCHLVVADDDMSREHAEIERRWDGVFVRDLDSKNGVLLHGERLAGERRLTDGALIEMGQTRLMLDDPRDRHLRQVQDGAPRACSPQQELPETHTGIRSSDLLAGATPIRPPTPATGRVRPLTLLVIAAGILLGAIGLALSFLLAR